MNAKDMKSLMSETKKRMDKAVEVTDREFKSIRTGRASITLVEGVQVNYYNTPTPLKGLATISTPDPKTILIQPWDQSAVAEIEKAILKADLGLVPNNDGKVLRIQIPPLSEERRTELTKILKKVAEDGRVSVRNARHDSIETLRKMKKDNLITEDDEFQGQKDIQKVTDEHIKKIDDLFEKKAKEIQRI